MSDNGPSIISREQLSPEALRRYETMLDLKKEHFIGSGEAYRIALQTSGYELLLGELEEEFGSSLSLKSPEIGVLCSHIASICAAGFRMEAAVLSSMTMPTHMAAIHIALPGEKRGDQADTDRDIYIIPDYRAILSAYFHTLDEQSAAIFSPELRTDLAALLSGLSDHALFLDPDRSVRFSMSGFKENPGTWALFFGDQAMEDYLSSERVRLKLPEDTPVEIIFEKSKFRTLEKALENLRDVMGQGR